MFLPSVGGYGESDSYVLTVEGESALTNNRRFNNNGNNVIDRGDIRRHLREGNETILG